MFNIENNFTKYFFESNTGISVENSSLEDLLMNYSKYDDVTLNNGYAYNLMRILKFDKIKIKKNCIVTKIKKRNKLFYVYNSEGHEFSSKCLIITVSIGVLNSRRIEFDPPLEKKINYALNNLKMGFAERICFTSNILKKWKNSYVYVNYKDVTIGFEFYPSNMPYISGYVVANDVFKKNINDLALCALKNLDENIQVAHQYISTWSNNPLFYGSYSASNIGGNKYRKILKSSLPPLYFAGEAVSNNYGTVHGAWESGVNTARECIKYIDSINKYS